MDSISNCILCNSKSQTTTLNDNVIYDCKNCTTYSVPVNEIQNLESNDSFQKSKKIISGIIFNNKSNEPLIVSNSTWKNILDENYNKIPRSFEEKSIFLLNLIYNLANGTTAPIKENIPYTSIYAKSEDELYEHFSNLKNKNYIYYKEIKTSNAGKIIRAPKITKEGIQYIEENKNNKDFIDIKEDTIIQQEDNFDKIKINISDQIHINESDYSPKLNVQSISKTYANLINNINVVENKGLFGVLGKWGRGKTYFIRFLIEELQRDPNIDSHIIHFSAWQYQKAPELWAHLFEKIAESRFDGKWKLLKIFSFNFCQNPIKTIFKILMPFLWIPALYIIEKYTIAISNWIIITPPFLILLFTQFYEKIKSSSDIAKGILKKLAIRKSFEKVLGLQNEIQKELKLLLKSWIKSKEINKKQIILIVDDIDRCNPENILEFLDSLRVILDEEIISNRLKVIIAIDHTILKLILEKRYGKYFIENNELHKDEYIRNYFDKIFLFAIQLSPLSLDQRLEIIDSIYESNNKIELIDDPNLQSIRKVRNNFQNMANTFTIPQFASSDLWIRKEEHINISEYEIELFKKYFSELQCTPRRFRILYYRYLFLKNIINQIEKNHFNDSELVPSVLRKLLDHEEFQKESTKNDNIQNFTNLINFD